MPESHAVANARRNEVKSILKENQIGSHRSLLVSLNEFRDWGPGEVKSVFDLLPPTEDRKLSPLGPEARYPPAGMQRWKELAMKVGLMAAVNAAVLLFSPALILSKRGQETLTSTVRLNFRAIGSSFFVRPSNGSIREAARTGKALCVNKWGQFRVLDKDYAAISHVWVETMGLEFHDEKIEQDERGLNFDHFSLIMAQATKCGFDWIWFDLLAIPRNSDDPTKSDEIRKLKTSILNSLHNIYRNAEAVIILDSSTLQLKSNDPIHTAIILCCGRWLTRIWTYQEIKLARKAFIVTADRWVNFKNMVDALQQEELKDYNRWHSMRQTFDRLLPHADVGVSLADIAASSQNRNSTNDIDYARGFFAVLGLKWKTGWTYEDGVLEIIKSQPQHAARIANMSGMRGLPEPYSWAPKYLVQLEGMVFDEYMSSDMGLIGFWYTITVKRIKDYGTQSDHSELIFNAEVLDKDGVAIDIQMTLPHTWSDRLTRWLDEARPDGLAKLLCARNPLYSEHAHVFLMVLQNAGESIGVCDGCGTVAGTAVLNFGELEGKKLKWWLF